MRITVPAVQKITCDKCKRDCTHEDHPIVYVDIKPIDIDLCTPCLALFKQWLKERP